MHRFVNSVDSRFPTSWKRRIKRLAPGLVTGFYTLLGKLTKDRYEEITIQSGHLEGRRFWCSLKKERAYFVGNYEPEVQNLIVSLLKPGMVFYDIGGHNGFLSLLAAKQVGKEGKVVTFEPNPSNVEIIKTNLALNKDIAARIELHPFAVSDTAGKAPFAGAFHSSMGRVYSSVEPLPLTVYEVATISLDEFTAAFPAPDMIKMDIEGGEVKAFRGMQKLLQRKRPVILVEIHHENAHEALLEFLHDHEYLARQVRSTKHPNSNPEWSGLDQYLVVPSETA